MERNEISRMTTPMNESEYISAWTFNAKQHFDDGDYEWICQRIKQIPSQKPINRILEIGCGSGYSTLTFIFYDFEIVSIDSKTEAISATKELIEAHDYTPAEESVRLIQADIIHDFKRIREEIAANPVDLIVLCNPGGNTETMLTKQEKYWLDWGNFCEEEYVIENLPLLHTYAIINASCGLAHQTDTPILIVMRDLYNEIENTLAQIGADAGVRLINSCLRPIKRAPDSGVPLSGDQEEQAYWGMGLYLP